MGTYNFVTPVNPNQASVTGEFLGVFNNLMKQQAQQQALQMDKDQIEWRKQQALIRQQENDRRFQMQEDRYQRGIDKENAENATYKFIESNKNLLKSGNTEDLASFNDLANRKGIDLSLGSQRLESIADRVQVGKDRVEGTRRFNVTQKNLKEYRAGQTTARTRTNETKPPKGVGEKFVYTKEVSEGLTKVLKDYKSFSSDKFNRSDFKKTRDFVDSVVRGQPMKDVPVDKTNPFGFMINNVQPELYTEVVAIESGNPTFGLITERLLNNTDLPKNIDLFLKNPIATLSSNVGEKYKAKFSKASSLLDLFQNELTKQEGLEVLKALRVGILKERNEWGNRATALGFAEEDVRRAKDQFMGMSMLNTIEATWQRAQDLNEEIRKANLESVINRPPGAPRFGRGNR